MLVGPFGWDNCCPHGAAATEPQAPVRPLLAFYLEALAEEGVEGVSDKDYVGARSCLVRTELGSMR